MGARSDDNEKGSGGRFFENFEQSVLGFRRHRKRFDDEYAPLACYWLLRLQIFYDARVIYCQVLRFKTPKIRIAARIEFYFMKLALDVFKRSAFDEICVMKRIFVKHRKSIPHCSARLYRFEIIVFL